MSTATQPTANFDESCRSTIKSYNFQPHSPPRCQRAWERAPKSPFAPQHKGRKVWKRYDLRVKETVMAGHDQIQNSSDEIANSLPPVKRLRLGPTQVILDRQVEQRSARYITTLRDYTSGTPRRKITKQADLQRRGTPTLYQPIANVRQIDDQPNGIPLAAVSASSNDHMSCFVHDTVDNIVTEDDSKVFSPRPSTLNPRIDVESVNTGESGEDWPTIPQTHSDQLTEESIIVEEGFNPEVELNPSKEVVLLDMHNLGKINERGDGEVLVDTSTVATLQNECADEDLATHNPLNAAVEPMMVISQARELLDLESGIEDNKVKTNQREESGSLEVGVEETINEPLHSTEQSGAVPAGTQSTEELADISAQENLDEEVGKEHSNDELSAEASTALGVDLLSVHARTFQGRTRSSARFSDDTNVLKDFLHRTQAQKAARSDQGQELPSEPASPRRSPRKVLAHVENNLSTPTRLEDEPRGLDVSPEKQIPSTMDFNEIDELTIGSTSCRRSTRSRVTAKIKLPLGTPSCIPLRRGDGGESVVLPRSSAQELTSLTRTNTQRNMGQSKAPKYLLRDLAGREPESLDVTEHLESYAKKVSWDDQLVYYVGAVGEKEGKEDERARFRKLRGSGVARNGTPAAKKVVMEASAVRARRSGKSKG